MLWYVLYSCLQELTAELSFAASVRPFICTQLIVLGEKKVAKNG